MKNPELIVGAGFAGLLAAHAWPDIPIFDAADGPRQTHKALLRCRSQAISDMTGIPFKQVTVRKGIYSDGKFVQPNIGICNAYAQKVVGVLQDRSIWNIDAVQRWMPPEDFYEQLLAAVDNRITWKFEYKIDKFGIDNAPIITTAPLYATLGQCDVTSYPDVKLVRGEMICVNRWRLRDNDDVHQTIYFPDPNVAMYRASICGNLMIAESIHGSTGTEPLFDSLAQAFNIPLLAMDPIDCTIQSNGKLRGLPDEIRRKILCELTTRHRVYSLGRFATWRNILLDDVVADIAVIRRLLHSDEYTIRKQYS